MARTDYGAILSTVIKDTSDSIREVERSVSNIAPNAWGTHIRSMKNDSDYQNVIDNLIEETISDTAIASFTDGAKGIPLKNLVVDINAVQSGSGTPSPTNVRAISGWSSCNVTRCGKNIADIKSYNEWETFDAYRLLKNTLPNTLLIMSITNKDTSVDVSGCYFGFFSNNYNSGAPSNYVWAITGGNYSNVSNLKNGEYLGALAFYPQTEETYNKLFSRFNIQIEVGSTATAGPEEGSEEECKRF